MTYYRTIGSAMETAMAGDPIIDEDHPHAVDPASVQQALRTISLGAIATPPNNLTEAQAIAVPVEVRPTQEAY